MSKKSNTVFKLTLIRHSTPDIPEGTCYGFSDIPVAQTFNDELSLIRKKIQHNSYQPIFSSPLIRCSQLAMGLFPKASITFDERLKELNFGDWEGMPWDEISKTGYAQAWFNDYVNTPCPGGESFTDLMKRVKLFLNDLPEGEAPCIITHSGTIRAFYVLLQSMPPKEAFDLKIPFGGFVEIEAG